MIISIILALHLLTAAAADGTMETPGGCVVFTPWLTNNQQCGGTYMHTPQAFNQDVYTKSDGSCWFYLSNRVGAEPLRLVMDSTESYNYANPADAEYGMGNYYFSPNERLAETTCPTPQVCDSVLLKSGDKCLHTQGNNAMSMWMDCPSSDDDLFRFEISVIDTSAPNHVTIMNSNGQFLSFQNGWPAMVDTRNWDSQYHQIWERRVTSDGVRFWNIGRSAYLAADVSTFCQAGACFSGFTDSDTASASLFSESSSGLCPETTSAMTTTEVESGRPTTSPTTTAVDRFVMGIIGAFSRCPVGYVAYEAPSADACLFAALEAGYDASQNGASHKANADNNDVWTFNDGVASPICQMWDVPNGGIWRGLRYNQNGKGGKDNFIGQPICELEDLQVLSEAEDDIMFTLRGTKGSERVRIIVGEIHEEADLTTGERLFTFPNPGVCDFYIEYLKDHGIEDDVMFRATTPVDAISAENTPASWNCGKQGENPRCQMIAHGTFAWKTTYRIQLADCGSEPSASPTPAPTASPRTDVCFGWGDPHVSSFHPISKVNGLWNVYDRQYTSVGWESYFKLEKDNGDVFEIKCEHEDLQGNGLTFIVFMKVFINNREVVSFAPQVVTAFNPTATVQNAILDASEVQIGANGQVWPTGSGLSMPYKYSFSNWPQVKIHFNFWGHTRRVDMGIMFSGPGGVPGRAAKASGLCCTSDSCPNRSQNRMRRFLAAIESPNPRASLPIVASPICPTQQQCCDRFAQHDVLYKSCLVDNVNSCCSIGADAATCCTADVAKCGVDFECEAGQKCTDAGFCVEDQPDMCKGEWTTFSHCSITTCGDGTQTRTYTIVSPAKNGGASCPALDGQVETRSCTVGKCGDVCEGIVCDSPTICMKSVGICQDASAELVGLRMHRCTYEPLSEGASCALGTCDGKGHCISASVASKDNSSESMREILQTKALIVGTIFGVALVSMVLLAWKCLKSSGEEKSLNNMWNGKDIEIPSVKRDAPKANSLGGGTSLKDNTSADLKELQEALGLGETHGDSSMTHYDPIVLNTAES